MAYVFLPVFYRAEVTSTFEYLERRFDRRIRLLGSFIYIMKYILFIPLVIYIPALAFSQGNKKRNTHFNLHLKLSAKWQNKLFSTKKWQPTKNYDFNRNARFFSLSLFLHLQRAD